MSQTIERYILILALAGLTVMSLAVAQGCSTRQQTQTTVTHSYTPTAADNSDPQPEATTTTTTTTSNRPDSVLGATGHAVWTVVALPFRVVGDTLGLIF
jgi:Tfp pilus assembly protein PilV